MVKSIFKLHNGFPQFFVHKVMKDHCPFKQLVTVLKEVVDRKLMQMSLVIDRTSMTRKNFPKVLIKFFIRDILFM
jgi:hypothetical protein